MNKCKERQQMAKNQNKIDDKDRLERHLRMKSNSIIF